MSLHEIRIQTILVSGRLDALRATSLRTEIEASLESGVVRFVVDLTEATFIDSAGLAALAKGMKEARLRGGDLRLVAARDPNARRVFELTRFDQVFTMGDSIEDLVNTW